VRRLFHLIPTIRKSATSLYLTRRAATHTVTLKCTTANIGFLILCNTVSLRTMMRVAALPLQSIELLLRVIIGALENGAIRARQSQSTPCVIKLATWLLGPGLRNTFSTVSIRKQSLAEGAYPRQWESAQRMWAWHVNQESGMQPAA